MNAAATVPRTGWRRVLDDILHTRTSPSRTAASLALGLGVGLSPLLGLHTLIAIVLAFVLDLNRVGVVAATCVFNPWTAIPIVALELKIGSLALGRPIPILDASAAAGVEALLTALHPFLPTYLVGGVVLALIVGLFSYPPVYVFIRLVRGIRAAA